MTFEKLQEIVTKNSIPKDVKLMSDSGWECCETDMDGVYYSKSKNTIIFTQDGELMVGGYDFCYRNQEFPDLKEIS